MWDERISRRTLLAGALGAAGALALGSCSTETTAKPVSGRPLLHLAGSDYGFPSPFAYIRGPGYWLMSFIYDSLLWKDDSGRLIPWLAEHYTRSPDGMTYTFTLRTGIRWQDGHPLTADDVAFTFDYFAHQHLSPQIFVRPGPYITSARATSAQDVTVALSAPVVTFLDAVAAALPIVPRHVWQRVSDAYTARSLEVLVGSGPYRLVAYTPGVGDYRYVVNDGFFLGKPYVRGMDYVEVGNELTALLAGTIDTADETGPRPSDLVPFEHNPKYGILRGPEDFTYALYWNLARGGALADRTFRQACCYAIDREAMVTHLLGGDGQPGNPGFLPPSNPWYVPVRQYRYDPAKANAMLDQAGYRRPAGGGTRRAPDGSPLSFTLLVANNPVPPATDFVVNDLAAIGVALTVTPVDLSSLDDRTTSGSYEMAITNFGGLGGDPDYLRRVYDPHVPKAFQSAQGYDDPTFNALAERQLVTLDPTTRHELVAEMQRIVAEDVPLLPLYYPYFVTVYRRDVFDAWYYTPGGFGGGVPTIYNKQALVTGRKTGLAIRGS
jgi:peptide/nickel transport system substrate-binding protein